VIGAAMVGLGWWDRTLVESAENSDAIRFTAGATRTISPEVEAFASRRACGSCRTTTRFCPTRASTCRAGDASFRAHDAGNRGRRGWEEPVYCDKPFTLTKREAEDSVAAARRAGTTLAVDITAVSIRK
jgi:hypothetical protein